MNGNSIFDIRRMKLLMSRDLRENWRQLLLTAGAIFGILVVIVILTVVVQKESFRFYSNDIDNWYRHIEMVEVGWLIFALFAWGALVASSTFKSLSTPRTALSMLILPASLTEKFIYRWLIVVPVFLVAFMVFAIIADCIRVGFTVSYYDLPARTADWWTLFVHPKEAGYFSWAPLVVIGIFLAVQSFFLLGSVVWPRLSFAKTFVCLIAMAIIYGEFGAWFYDLLSDPDKWYGAPAWLDNEEWGPLLFAGFFIIVALFNYCLTFMRFREAEIINRW